LLGFVYIDINLLTDLRNSKESKIIDNSDYKQDIFKIALTGVVKWQIDQ